jgi:hypothetical protein
LSERNLDVSNDTIFLVHITDTIGAAGQSLTVEPLISSQHYFVPVNGLQPGAGDSLSTNDSRVLGSFIENNQIQFVGNTTDTSTGTSAFYHGVITNVSSSPSVALQIISDDTTCYGYPNIAYAGNSTSDNTAIVNVLRSSIVQFLGYSAFVTDGNGNFSSEKNVKNGISYHAVIAGNERWGDYSGSQRKYNQPGVVWVNGSFGRIDHKVSTWISELSLTPLNLGIQNPTSSLVEMKSFPNPSAENFSVYFNIEKLSRCTFNLFDASGRLVKELLDEYVKPGENEFSFSLQPLPPGIYFLKIASAEKLIGTSRIVKQ